MRINKKKKKISRKKNIQKKKKRKKKKLYLNKTIWQSCRFSIQIIQLLWNHIFKKKQKSVEQTWEGQGNTMHKS